MAELDVSGGAKSIVKSFYELGAQGQITSFAPMLADDFELFVPPYLPWGGHFNKGQYIALLPQVVKALDFARMRYVSLTEEGGHVVALIEIGVQGTCSEMIIDRSTSKQGDPSLGCLFRSSNLA